MDNLERVILLCRRRWATPLLAELHRLQGAKFVTLVHRTGASAGAVRQTLDDLISRGWVERNPGYGHPLRPEYILSAGGGRVAPTCARLQDAVDLLGVTGAALRRWSMPVLYVIGRPRVDATTPPGSADRPARRFSEIAGALVDITDRALALTLRDLSGAGLVARHCRHVPTYRPTRRGAGLMPILASL